jgi:hypothetical protein
MVYLQLLREYGERYAVRWWGYCLMSNHVHLVAVPMKENALANALGRAHSDYARYANVKLRTSGHFWQNRYYSCEREWRAERGITRGQARQRACRAVIHPDSWTWRNGGNVIHQNDGVTSWRRGLKRNRNWSEFAKRRAREGHSAVRTSFKMPGYI